MEAEAKEVVLVARVEEEDKDEDVTGRLEDVEEVDWVLLLPVVVWEVVVCISWPPPGLPSHGKNTNVNVSSISSTTIHVGLTCLPHAPLVNTNIQRYPLYDAAHVSGRPLNNSLILL